MINVTCAIIIKDNKILVTQRSELMKLPLKWEFPGGKLIEGETEIECIKREIREELSIEIEIHKQLTNSVFNYDNFIVNLIPFVTYYVSGDVKLTEHNQYKLLDPSELMNLDWAEADIPIVKEFLNL
jgi:8-oxo-dGTP diphosphatase